MAAVLSKIKQGQTHVFYNAVNTPDYLPDGIYGTDNGGWIINPDLTSVANVPMLYWAIDTTPAFYDIDGITILSEETYAVREMTVQEKAAYEAAIPVVIPTDHLADGTPSFYDTVRSVVRSINETEIVFTAKTIGAKNFYLNTPSTVSSNLNGFLVAHNGVILSIYAMHQEPQAEDVIYFDIINNATQAIITTLTLPAGQTIVKSGTLNIAIADLTELSCYVRSTVDVVNPMVHIAFSKTN